MHNAGMRYWLIKSEPGTYSIDDLKRDKTTGWEGVRNYQARNFIREMKKGDLALFYHSNANPPCVAGVAAIVKDAYPDPENPTWETVEVGYVKKFPRAVSLAELKANPRLSDLLVTKKGSRLSVQPVSREHFEEIAAAGKKSV